MSQIAEWDQLTAGPTPKQDKLLGKMNVDTARISTMGEASAAIATKLQTNRKDRFMGKLKVNIDGADDAFVEVDEIGGATLVLRFFEMAPRKKDKIKSIRTVRLDWDDLKVVVKCAKKGAGAAI